MIKGIQASLKVKTKTGTDAFNRDVFEEEYVTVENVLVGEPSPDDIITATELYGKKAAYTLGIPKTDTHDWVDTEVVLPEPFQGRYRTIGYPSAGIAANVPGPWNRKVKVERYGG